MHTANSPKVAIPGAYIINIYKCHAYNYINISYIYIHNKKLELEMELHN